MLRFLHIALLAMVGCNSGKTELGRKPDKLVPEPKMAQMLAQVHFNEARVAKYSLGSADSASIVYNRLHMQMLKQFGVDTAAYTKSYIYYSANPALLASIYEQVLEELKTRQKKAEKQFGGKPTGSGKPI
jgi:Domain of unknown function (DUF4296)